VLDKPLNGCNYFLMLWIGVAVTALLAAPVPANMKKWFYPDDVPVYLIERSPGLWWVGIRMTVRPDGSILGCDVERKSGIPELDDLTCSLASHRAKFLPAHWSDGSPAFGVYRTSISWAVSDAPFDTSKLSNPDLDVFVQSLPGSIKSPALVRVMFAVDQVGNMSSCQAEPTPAFEKTENNPVLAPVACDQLIKSYKAVPANDAAGKAIGSVQDALVRFASGRRQ
jgi:hypothetical protein